MRNLFIAFSFFINSVALFGAVITPLNEEVDTFLVSLGVLRGSGMNFIENRGQIIDMNGNVRPDILFTGDAGGMKVYLRKGGISYVLEKRNERKDDIQSPYIQEGDAQSNIQMHRIDLDFVNASSLTQVLSSDQVEGYINYYYAHSPAGIIGVRAYNRVVYQNIYPNIDIVFYGGKGQGLKYDFIVKPGGDPNNIRLKYSGADNIEVIRNRLKVISSLGALTEELPRVYQNSNGKIIDVEAEYKLDGTTVSLQLTAYSLQLPLIIDPWITYFGGTGVDAPLGITTDQQGNAIFTGNTKSSNFPVLGAYQGSIAGGEDMFVAKMSSNGNLMWSTYYGGTQNDRGCGIAVDLTGNIYVSGTTASSNFPIGALAGNLSWQSIYPGKTSATIVKLDPLGQRIWSTFYGDFSGFTSGADITIDQNSNVLLYGSTNCTSGIATAATFQTTAVGLALGINDAFVIKFNSTGNRIWGSYCGGSGNDIPNGIDCDKSNNIYIVGGTYSTDFPVTSGAHQTIHGGSTCDGFIFKFDPLGQRLWGSYYGGYGIDAFNVTATDKNGDVYAAGITNSINANAISTPGAFQTGLAGNNGDGVIAKFDSTGVRQWATYLGGKIPATSIIINGIQFAKISSYIGGLVVDVNGNIIVAGDTYVTDFPVTSCAYQTVFKGTECQFISRFTNTGSLLCSGYIGDGISSSLNNERAANVGEMNGGNMLATWGGVVYLDALTACIYPVTANAYQQACGGGSDAAIAQLCINTCGLPAPTTANFSASATNVCSNVPVNFTLNSTVGSCDTSRSSYLWSFPGATPATSTLKDPSGIAWSSPGAYGVSVKIVNCDTTTVSQPNYITITPCGLNVQTTGQSVCSGSCATVSAVANSGNAPYTYNWNNGSTAQMISVCPSSTTMYTVTVSDNSGATTTGTATVTIPTPLSANPSVASVRCNGGSNGTAVASPSGGSAPYTYSWSGSATGNQSSVSGLSQGNYSVTITDALGCVTNTAINVTEPPALSVTTNTATANCNQGSGSASVNPSGGTGPYNYLWSSSASGGSTTQQISNLSSGTYSVTVTDDNGCTIATAITVGNMPGVTAQVASSTSASCFGTCNGLASVSGIGGTNPYTYQWSGGLSGTNATASNLCATAYTATITDAAGCFSVANVTITEPSLMKVQSTGYNVQCKGDSTGNASVIVTGGNAPYTYSWLSVISNQSSVNGLPAGNYTVAITDNNGCSLMDTIIIAEPFALTYTINTTSETCGQANGTAAIHLTGGVPGYFYFWSSSSGGNDSAITNQPSGTYTVYVQDNNGCSIQASATVNNTGNPANITINPIACNSYTNNGQTYTVSGIYTHTLNTTAGCDSILTINLIISNSISTTETQNICSGQSAIIHGISQDTAGFYTQTFFATGGCDSTSTVTLNVENSPIANAGNDTTITAGQTVILSASGGSGTGTYSWNTGQTTSMINQQLTSTATYILIVTDNNGCNSSDTITVFVNTPCDNNTEVFVPNSFSPNGDGQNDELKLYSTGTPETIYFTIYNRWGEKVFECSDLSSTWDGIYRNKLCDTAVFTWVLKITCEGTAEEVIKMGNISLMR